MNVDRNGNNPYFHGKKISTNIVTVVDLHLALDQSIIGPS